MVHSNVYKRSRRDLKKEKFLTVMQVSKRLGVCTSSVYALINSGDIASVNTGLKKGIKIKESEFERFVEHRST
ncbi:helix-turn-helix domain-containing protein [Candidatus Pacearchaeota archaeon]|nr:helix-turn-helix domain-containing protein [Candidatus Pacearchaeota archaeon]